MTSQEHIHKRQKLANEKIKPKTETEKPKRPLPMWCRGIMGGCTNCGGCVP